MQIIISVVLSVAALLMPCSTAPVHAHDEKPHSGTNIFTKHFRDTLFAITVKGEFSVEILLDEKEYKIGNDVIGIVIHDKHDEDVEGAAIKVFSVVPGSSSGSLAAIDKGSGLYTVKTPDLSIKGPLELRVEIKKKALEDSAIFLFPAVMEKPLPAGRYSADDPAFKKR